jgi:class 3 adenylate cyclase
MALAELLQLRQTLREIVPYFGLRIAKWLGDGAMLVGTETEKLVAATVGIAEQHQQSGRLPLRAGIAAGPVLMVDGDDYTGRAVNLAARLCQTAQPGQILAAVNGLVQPEWIDIKDTWSVSVRGLQDTVAVVSLGLMGSGG